MTDRTKITVFQSAVVAFLTTVVLVFAGAAPASAHSGTGGYCGHGNSTNWITGRSVTYMWDAPPQAGRHSHYVRETNVYTGTVYGTFIHVC